MRIDVGGVAFVETGAAGAGVEVGRHAASGGVVVRNGRDRTGPALVFTGDQWRALVVFVALGEWPPEYVTWAGDGRAAFMTVPGDRSFLRFTAEEMTGFAEAVARGEFALCGPLPARG